MSGKMCDWRLVETGSGVDIDSVDHIFGALRSIGGMGRFVLSSGGEQQAAIWSECQPPKKRRQGFVGIDVRIFHPKTMDTKRIRGIFHWPYGWQWH